MEVNQETNRHELRNKLKSKIAQKRMSRFTKVKKDTIVENNLKKMGMNKEQLQTGVEEMKNNVVVEKEEVKQTPKILEVNEPKIVEL